MICICYCIHDQMTIFCFIGSLYFFRDAIYCQRQERLAVGVYAYLLQWLDCCYLRYNQLKNQLACFKPGWLALKQAAIADRMVTCIYSVCDLHKIWIRTIYRLSGCPEQTMDSYYVQQYMDSILRLDFMMIVNHE